MSWFKRYLVGCLIAAVFAGLDVYAALVAGGTIGDAVHGTTSGKAG